MGIKQDSYEGINQFTLGEFVDYNQATDFLNVIKEMGFKDAFIMSFKNGIRIKTQEAIAIKQKAKSADSLAVPNPQKETTDADRNDGSQL